MKVTITIPSSLIGVVPDIKEFATRVVLEALEREEMKQTQDANGKKETKVSEKF